MPSIQDIICSLFILVAAGSFGALYRYRIRRARRSGLECGECGYLTAHASGARCPECGTPWLKGDGRTFSPLTDVSGDHPDGLASLSGRPMPSVSGAREAGLSGADVPST